jgi:hypothetical protein
LGIDASWHHILKVVACMMHLSTCPPLPNMLAKI